MHNTTHHGPKAGAVTQYGDSTAGTRGLYPRLGATGPFRPGHNSGLELRHVKGNTLAMIVAGVNQSSLTGFPWGGVNTYVWPQPFQALVPIDARGTWSFVVKLAPSIAGLTIYFQAYALDDTAPNGIVSTNGVQVRYGN